jgi:hypothetical protein
LEIRTKKVGTTLGVLALVVATATAALWFRQIGQVDIPEDRTTYVISFLSAVALGVGAFVAGVRWFGGVAAALAIVIGSFFPFTIAVSPQEVAANALRVGDSIPVFSALDENGEVFESKMLAGKPVLIKFFRGLW